MDAERREGISRRSGYGRCRHTQESRRDESAQNDPDCKGDVPCACLFPVIAQKRCLHRECRGAQRAQTSGHAKLSIAKEQQNWNKEAEERSGDVPRPRSRQEVHQRSPASGRTTKLSATRPRAAASSASRNRTTNPDSAVSPATTLIALVMPIASATTPASSAPAAYPRSRQ